VGAFWVGELGFQRDEINAKFCKNFCTHIERYLLAFKLVFLPLLWDLPAMTSIHTRHIRAHTHFCSHMHAHTHACTHTHRHTHSLFHTHTHTHMRAHTHTGPCPSLLEPWRPLSVSPLPAARLACASPSRPKTWPWHAPSWITACVTMWERCVARQFILPSWPSA